MNQMNRDKDKSDELYKDNKNIKFEKEFDNELEKQFTKYI